MYDIQFIVLHAAAGSVSCGSDSGRVNMKPVLDHDVLGRNAEVSGLRAYVHVFGSRMYRMLEF